MTEASPEPPAPSAPPAAPLVTGPRGMALLAALFMTGMRLERLIGS